MILSTSKGIDNGPTIESQLNHHGFAVIPPGTYHVYSTINIVDKDAISLIGSGPGISRLLFHGVNHGIYIKDSRGLASEGITIRDISILSNDLNHGIGLALEAVDRNTSCNALIDNVDFGYSGATSWNSAIYINGMYDGTISNSRFRGAANTLENLRSNSFVRFSGSLRTMRWNIIDNMVAWTQNGIYSITPHVEGIQVRGNNMIGVNYGVYSTAHTVQFNIIDNHIHAFMGNVIMVYPDYLDIRGNLFFIDSDKSGLESIYTYGKGAFGVVTGNIYAGPSDSVFIKSDIDQLIMENNHFQKR